MLVTIGEILVDLIGEESNGSIAYRRFAGGAPFNVACAAKRVGGVVGFVGSVGDDLFGAFLSDFAVKRGFDYIDVSADNNRNTTLALVQLDAHGERSFCFCRKNTADYFISADRVKSAVANADTVCLGTLMLGEPEGLQTADAVVAECKARGVRLCLDVNYREDIFKGKDPRPVYEKYIAAADVLKFSEEELYMLAPGSGLDDKLARAATGDRQKLACVTLGAEGCAYAFGGKVRRVGSIKVKPQDTTGAGDAFFGCLLAQLDGKDIASIPFERLDEIFFRANVCGALTTQKRGAIDALPSKREVFDMQYGNR